MMIEAPPSHDIRPVSSEAPPTAPSKASMMIAAYRAARLNQRLARRPAAEVVSQPPSIDPEPAEPVADGMETVPQAALAASDPPSADVVATEVLAPPADEPEPDRDSAAASAADDGPADPDDHGQEVSDQTEPFAMPAVAAGRAPILADIGLGPSMLIRLNQLGLHQVSDVAQANVEDLRAALGCSSRLVNVEAWIASARALSANGAAR